MLNIGILTVLSLVLTELGNHIHLMQGVPNRAFEGTRLDLIGDLSAKAIFVCATADVAGILDDERKSILQQASQRLEDRVAASLAAEGLSGFINLELERLKASSLSLASGNTPLLRIEELTKLRGRRAADFDRYVIHEQKLITNALNELPTDLREPVKQAMERIKYGRVGHLNYLLLASQEGTLSLAPATSAAIKREFQNEINSSQAELEKRLLQYHQNVLAALPHRVQDQLAGHLGFPLSELPAWLAAHRSSKWNILGASGMPLFQFDGGYQVRPFEWTVSISETQLLKDVLLRFGRMDELQLPLITQVARGPYYGLLTDEMLKQTTRNLDRFLVLVSNGEEEVTPEQIESVSFYRDLIHEWLHGPVSLSLEDWDYILAPETADQPVRVYIGSLSKVVERRPVPRITKPTDHGRPPLGFLNGRTQFANPVALLKSYRGLDWFAEISVEQRKAIHSLEAKYELQADVTPEVALHRQRDFFAELDGILTPGQSVTIFQYLFTRIGLGTYFMHPGVAAEYGMTADERTAFYTTLMSEVNKLQEAEQTEISRVLTKVFKLLTDENRKELEQNLGLSIDELILAHQQLMWSHMAHCQTPKMGFYELFDEEYLPNVTKFSDMTATEVRGKQRQERLRHIGWD